MRQRVSFAGAAGAATAVAVVLLVGTGLGWWSSAPAGGSAGPALAVRTSLEPQSSFFGDPLTAQAAVGLDTRSVDPSTLRVLPSFTPYAMTAAPAVSRSRSGAEETIVYRYRIQCVTDGCLPRGKALTLKLPKVTVRASATSGSRRLHASAAWPPLLVAPRVTSTDLARSGRSAFRRAATVPPPVYAVSPGALADGLTAAAGLLGLLAAALAAYELARLIAARRRRAAAELTRLERALLLAREAAARPEPADRRKALGLLAEALAAEGRPVLAETTGEFAWSEGAPTSAGTLELVGEVEAEDGDAVTDGDGAKRT